MDPVTQVLAAYPAVLRSAHVVPLGNRGGFSGARLWRLTARAGDFCLRGGAAAEAGDDFRHRHALMARARDSGLPFVPAVLPARDGGTIVAAAGRCWEVMDWMPGRADFSAFPTPARLRVAASALARLHRAWQPANATLGPCPAVERRWVAVGQLTPAALPLPFSHPLLDDLVARTRRALARWLAEAQRLLQPWREFACPLQPCLRDVWHDHLLFEGDELTGLVDYAAVGVDSVAADLARMLGSLVEDDDERWGMALETYRAERPLSADEERLARILDRTGVIGGLGNWLRWLADPGHSFPDAGLASRRLGELLRRAEAW